MGAEIERYVATCDEPRIEAPEATLSEWDGVIDGQRSEEPDRSTKLAHVVLIVSRTVRRQWTLRAAGLVLFGP
tara:strand:- start:71 stop:289 length:219 start_codon:yes stop_codon:yes gene_type:complete